MRRILLTALIVILALPSFLFLTPETKAASSSLPPLTPHQIKVLVVSPANTYYKGGHYLISDLARYGFNVTERPSDNATGINYVTDPQTSNLGQYDVVILHSPSLALPPAPVTVEEVSHFANFGGVLIVIGNALFRNETSGSWWSNLFTSAPIQRIEQRLGIDFTNYLKNAGATYPHNNGTFTLEDTSINGLPETLTYNTNDWIGNANNQLVVATTGASLVYNFTTAIGRPMTTAGVTYYKNATGAVGIYIQGAYIHATSPFPNRISYYGFTDISKRSALLASLIAYGLGKDVATIIKPQPLANVRLDDVGQYFLQPYLNASLLCFKSIVDDYNITPSISFTDYLDFKPDYWKTVAPSVLTQIKGEYSDWEYTSSLRKKLIGSMTKADVEVLIQNVMGNYTALGMDLFSTASPSGCSSEVLNAFAGKNLALMDLVKFSAVWWNLDVNSNVLVHQTAPMALSIIYENFTQIDSDTSKAKDVLHYEYFRYRDEWALAVVDGFPGFVYNVRNFRWNEVGSYSLQTLYHNLTYEIPDIRFVPLSEAAMYFGNKWASVQNPVRVGSDIEFDINSQTVPDVVGIGKGMLWLRIAANETISAVLVDGQPWHYFDGNSIRVPAQSTHVKVTLGAPVTPRVVRASNIVAGTIWGLARFTVSMFAQQGLNVFLRLQIPEDLFSGVPPVNWTVFSSERKWGYRFDASSRLLDFWAVSDDGLLTFKVGFDVVPPYLWSVNKTRTEYDSNVTITVNATELQTSIKSVILCYMYNNSEWVEVDMILQSGLYRAEIPAFPWGTSVKYRVNASDTTGNWAITQIVSYNVTDREPPTIGIPSWTPKEPSVGELVTVKVDVSEPSRASGIKRVNLWYRRHGGTWETPLPMVLQDGSWTVSFPALNTESVDFTIEALDNAGNKGITRIYTYNTRGSMINLPVLLLAAGAVAAAVSIGTVMLFVRRRRRLNRAEKPVVSQPDATALK